MGKSPTDCTPFHRLRMMELCLARLVDELDDPEESVPLVPLGPPLRNMVRAAQIWSEATKLPGRLQRAWNLSHAHLAAATVAREDAEQPGLGGPGEDVRLVLRARLPPG